MTKEERRNPKILNGSRRARIAAGSGVTVGEVNQLIVRFLEGQKMMRQMMGSMPGMGGMRRSSKARAKKKRGKGGGRPAGASRGTGQPTGRAAAASLDGGAQGGAGLGRPAGMGPAALPGFSSLPGLGDNNGGFRLPSPGGGQGAGQNTPPPAFRPRPGKKGH
jgi:signal recognition particle subunit SRP54